MEINMGEKIIALRKAKGMTQEQLAAALGVSAPAVSKWETNSSYPDITLLCPLARALGTDVDNLLAFEEELSQEKLGQYMVEIVEMARRGEVPRAEERLNALLHRYPSDIPLKFSAIAVLSFFEMNWDLGAGEDENREYCQEDDSKNQVLNEGCSENEKVVPYKNCGEVEFRKNGKEQEGVCQDKKQQDKERWIKQRKELAQAVHDDGNPAYYLSSVSMLVSLALAEGELEKAEGLLKENLTSTADFTALWVQLYLKKGERDQALGILQRQAYKLVADLRTCLACLMREDIGLERDRVVGICGILEQIDSLFSVGGSSGPGLFAEVYLRVGEQERALAYLEQLADQMTRRMDPPNPLVFGPAIAPGPEKLGWSREIKLAILQGLENDACFEPLRSQERFQVLVRKVADCIADSSRKTQE